LFMKHLAIYQSVFNLINKYSNKKIQQTLFILKIKTYINNESNELMRISAIYSNKSILSMFFLTS
jgi:hypothetical protein